MNSLLTQPNTINHQLSDYQPPFAITNGNLQWLVDEGRQTYLSLYSYDLIGDLGYNNNIFYENTKKTIEAFSNIDAFPVQPLLLACGDVIKTFLTEQKYRHYYYADNTSKPLLTLLDTIQQKTKKRDICFSNKELMNQYTGALDEENIISANFDSILPDINSFKTFIKENKKTLGAFFVNPYHISLNTKELSISYFKEISKICKRNKVLLIWDESNSGFGRTEHFFSHMNFGVIPDIIFFNIPVINHYYITGLMITESFLRGKTPFDQYNFSEADIDLLYVFYSSINYLSNNSLTLRGPIFGNLLEEGLEKIMGDTELITEINRFGFCFSLKCKSDSAAFFIQNELKRYGFLIKMIVDCSQYYLIIKPSFVITKKNINDFLNYLKIVTE
jgi:4-aminobutyrate aminotransferase-like enzyme